MRNKDLFKQKLDRIDGKVKMIRVMSTRQGTTVKDINEVLNQIDEQMSDLYTMLEREGTVYGR
jgi:septation ring formation regulator EzrA